MKARIGIIVTVLLVLAALSPRGTAQEDRKIELTAQGILARVDRILEYPTGQIKGLMKHITPDGRATLVNFTGSIAKDDYLFVFSSRERGQQLKVLYNLGGEDVWVYNIHSLKLFHKLGVDKYDAVLSTNYTFMDLSRATLQSNYTATIDGEAVVKGIDSWRLVLKPIFKGGEYGQLTLYVSKDKTIPLRIDYHDRDRAIFKFLTIVEVQEKGSRVVPLRYDMMDIRRGTVTIMNFTEFEPTVTFNKEIFRSEKLGE